MKILAIRGKNLASLEGEFEINFTTEPLKSAGIYAITGSTGSGKSTLLDALCLALFDEMPRTNQAGENVAIPDINNKTINQKDSRTILRKGTGEGYAEVEFISLGGERFRSTWSVKRAKGKADGSLQNSEMRLANLSANIEISGKKTELLIHITELIGFSFGQFTRAVLLTQGDFATFLKAKQSEKAELLEKLTGTTIYSRISIAIYEKSKKAEQDLSLLEERIKNIEVLSEEQTEQLKEEKKATDEKISHLKNTLSLLTEKINWIKQDTLLRHELAESQKQLADSQKKTDEAKPRYQYIHQIESVQEIRDSFRTLQQSKKQWEESEINLSKNENDRQANASLLEQAKQALSACEKEQKEAEDLFAKLEPDILKARELDVQLKSAATNDAEARKEVEVAKSSKEKLEKKLASFLKEKSSNQTNIDELNHWFEQSKTFAEIAPHTDLLVNLLNDAQTATEQSENKRQLIEKEQSFLKEDNKKLDILRQETDRLNKELPTEIAALREKLQEGIPCPVCGSIHHPLQGNNESSRLKEEELNKAKQINVEQINVLIENIEKEKNRIVELTTLTETYTKHAAEALAKVDEYLFLWSSWRELFKQGVLQKRLKKQSEKWNNTTHTLTLLKRTGDNLDINILNEQKNLQEANQIFETQKQKQIQTEAILTRLSEDRKKLLNSQSADETARYQANKKREITEKLKLLSDNKIKHISIDKSFNGRIEQIKSEIIQLKSQISHLETAVSDWMATQNGMTYEYLSELLSQSNDWLVSEKHFLDKLKESETIDKATVTEREKNLTIHCQASIKPKDENETQTFLEAEQESQNNLLEQKNTRSNEIESLLSSHTKGMEKINSFEKDLIEKRELSANWKKLNDLLGSANGTKFKEIAQGYTLDTLLVYSNSHLEQLSDRYALQRIPNTLALQVIDRDMLDEVRTVHSLSGGESFLVSLALALGLSSLSSNRMKVESLFIDEGFGSLDRDTLQIAMNALERLQNQGRKIGIISHVPEIMERIRTQVRVVKSANGKSKIDIVSA
ncbi:Nuclease SbcCD subunit C [termite gut metagenome]|uniref:Nuclease SbcCD subunit C n=1 Tax=termite gut metagenome TaxID=433724 RepID=A0A5J4RJ71_9ZZZZ